MNEIDLKPEKKKPILKSPLFTALLAISIVTAYLYLAYSPPPLNYRPPLQVSRVKFYDNFFRFRHAYYEAFDKKKLRAKDIVLVTIDEESYGRLGIRWPWNRDVFADFLNKLGKYNPKVVALDFALYGESPDNPEADKKLAEAMKKCGNVIIASVYGKEKLYLGPYNIFAKASAGYGVIGTIRDADSAIRQFKNF